jgi:alpha-L-arabinofuranosidase
MAGQRLDGSASGLCPCVVAAARPLAAHCPAGLAGLMQWSPDVPLAGVWQASILIVLLLGCGHVLWRQRGHLRPIVLLACLASLGGMTLGLCGRLSLLVYSIFLGEQGLQWRQLSDVQDALDLIEFANGDVNTKWGKLRADMGHPASFQLKLIAVGNEQWGSLYPERLEPFLKAIRAKHPEIKVIGSSGPSPDGKDFEYGWNEMKRLKADLVDEHYYKDPAWFLANAKRYDNYDRKGPKVFAGEYACHPVNRKNNFESALSEAAFMTGFERNADIVQMCTYAPLFAHVDGWQWRPDLIWFDNMRSVRSANYYVQQLYGHNVGTNVLTTVENKAPLAGQDGLYASSALDKTKNEIILKIANTSDVAKTVNYSFKGLKAAERNATHTILKSVDQDLENTLDQPNAIVPVTQQIKVTGSSLEVELAPKSFNLYVIKL